MGFFGNVGMQQSLDSEHNYIKFAAPTAAASVTLKSYETTIKVTTPASGVGVLVLPAEEEAAGRLFSFEVLNTGGGEVNVTLDDATTDAIGDNFSADGDFAVLYCDGTKYQLLAETTT